MNPIRSRFEGARRTLREDSTLQAVLKHTGWLTGSSGGIFILAALQGVLTGRLLGVEVWGMLGVAISFSMVTSRLLSFRMHEFVTKWVTEFLGDGTPRAATVFKLALVGRRRQRADLVRDRRVARRLGRGGVREERRTSRGRFARSR